MKNKNNTHKKTTLFILKKSKKADTNIAMIIALVLGLILLGLLIYQMVKAANSSSKTTGQYFECGGSTRIIGDTKGHCVIECNETAGEQLSIDQSGCPPKDNPELRKCCVIPKIENIPQS